MRDDLQPVKRPNRAPGYNHHPQRLKWRRVASGLSLTEAAKRAGCDKSHLSKAEHGVYSISVELLAQLARIYGCEIRDLMPDEPNGQAA